MTRERAIELLIWLSDQVAELDLKQDILDFIETIKPEPTAYLLKEDFESPNWFTHWDGETQHTTQSAATSHSGTKSLKVTVPKNEHLGSEMKFRYAKNNMLEPTEAYARYFVKFTNSWDLNVNNNNKGEFGKLPGFSGTYGRAGWGGRRSDGFNGWSARMSHFKEGSGIRLANYVYHANMGQWGTHFKWGGLVPRNKWICIEQRLKLNSISNGVGNPDGLIEGWVDGVNEFRQSGIVFRHTASLKIEQFWNNIYIGGTWNADRHMELYLDDIAISSARIGCS